MNSPSSLQTLTALTATPGFSRTVLLRLIAGCEKLSISLEEFWNKKRRWRNAVFALTEEQILALENFKKTWTPESYWQYLQSQGIDVISEQEFPELLKHIPDPPLLLFSKGNKECLVAPHVAIVGSRTPTRYGQWATQKVAAGLIEHDVSIVSGFMVGIDYQSHQVAVNLGGRSVGVLGFGFGEMYPSHLKHAADEFLEAGMLFITEYPPGMPPAKHQFPARNRIVAGLSAATIVVEARQKSGSLITAQCALDDGRLVGAVPGPIDSVYSQGTHHLLREGALLVETGQEVWEELQKA